MLILLFSSGIYLSIHVTESGYLKEGKSTVSSGLKSLQLP